MYELADIRNLILLSHFQAGKTSLTEALLFNAGAISRLGKVTQGTTTTDYSRDEIERKISIDVGFAYADYKDKRIHLVDTPGYADFIGDLIGGMWAADSALIVVDAVRGIEAGTEKMWKRADKMNLPRMIFINKLDKENADFDKVQEAIIKRFGKKCILFTYPVGQGASFKEVVNLITAGNLDSLGDDKARASKLKEALTESIAESDDSLLEKYLEGNELSKEEIVLALRSAVLNKKIVPVFVGSALQNIGIRELLEAVCDYLPGPPKDSPRKGKNPDNGGTTEKKAGESGTFCGQVIKTISDPYVGQLTIFKVFSGRLESNTSFYNSSTRTKERIGQLYQLQGKEQRPKQTASTGDIAAVSKLKNTRTGDTLCDEKSKIIFAPFRFPEAAISRAVKPRSRGDEGKISGALHKLTSEDPTFVLSRDAQTNEQIILGLGNLQIDVMVTRLKNRFHVEIDLGTPKVAYKETVLANADSKYRHKKQSGGAGQFAEVWLRIEPLERGKGFEFVNDTVGGSIPAALVISCEKGIRSAITQGVLAGCPIVDVRAIVYDGKTHPVDSKDIAFQIAAREAFKQAFVKAKPIILEPIMELEISVPSEYMGDITGNLNSRRGRILGMDAGDTSQTVRAHVPLAEVFKYASELKSMTHGRGAYTMKFSHYIQAPAKVQENIIAKFKQERQEKEK